MTILQNFQPMTRARMAQLSLPDIRAYAKTYKVPADVIERGTVDELLDFIFELRPRHPQKYPLNTPHLFTHKIARTQNDRDEDFLNHKQYRGFTRRGDLTSFRRAKSWVGRPPPPNGGKQASGATEEQRQIGEAEAVGPKHPPAQGGDSPVMGQPVAPSNTTPTYQQPNTPAEHLPEELSQTVTLPRSALHEVSNQGIPFNPIPKLPPNHRGFYLPEWMGKTTFQGVRPPPGPPPLGFEVADDLSNLKSALEEHEETVASLPSPPRIIMDDELFDMEFTADMTPAGKEAVVRERYAIAMSNHKMIEQMLSEAEAEAKQALWQLTALQPHIDAASESTEKFLDEFGALTGHRGPLRQAIVYGERLAQEAWERDWNEEWIHTDYDQKEDERMKENSRARAAGIQSPPSPSAQLQQSSSRKRTRNEDEDDLEYADEDELRTRTPEPDPKRSRVGSAAPPSPPPKGNKGKGRALVPEDSYTPPYPSSSFYIPPLPMPRFGPEDRCNVYPIYKPAVPGFELSMPPGAEDGNLSGEQDGGNLPTLDANDNSANGPEPDHGQETGHDGGEEQIGEDEATYEAEGYNQSATQMPPRGAPFPAQTEPKGPQPGDPWTVLRYDRFVRPGYDVTDHAQLSSELKRPVNWSVMGSEHPKGASYREWDDKLEEQNPWHQGGRPILKQQ